MRDFFSKCTIYVATSPSGKQYVGQTVQTFEDRINSHKSSSSNCTLLKYAIRKYGFDNLSWKVIEEIPTFLLNDRERHWIKVLNTMAPNGYNCDTGGNARKELSQTLKDNIKKGKCTHKIKRDGYLGYVRKEGKYFKPVVKPDGKQIYLSNGGFDTREEAVEVLKEYTKDPDNFTKVGADFMQF